MKPWNELSGGGKARFILALLIYIGGFGFFSISALLHEDGGITEALVFATIGVFVTWLGMREFGEEESKGQDSGGEMVPQLQELAQMREMGQLSEAEYAQAKQRLLNK